MPIATRETKVLNANGLHARPAFLFVETASQFASQITVHKGGEEPADADAKSVMQMIILAAVEGTPLRIEADGEDAEAAVSALVKLVEDKFGEDP